MAVIAVVLALLALRASRLLTRLALRERRRLALGRPALLLERRAVLDSRPGKAEPVPADELRWEWLSRAQAAGFDALTLPDRSRPVGDAIPDDEEIRRGLGGRRLLIIGMATGRPGR